MSAFRLLLVALLALSTLGCSDDSGTTTPPEPDKGLPEPDGGVDDAVTPTPDSTPPDQRINPPCPCDAGQVCGTVGYCVPAPTPQLGEGYAELVLLRQRSPHVPDILSHLGKGEVLLKNWSAVPTDERPHWTTSDGGDCAYEVDTVYPYYYKGENWPAGDGLSAGNVIFRPEGAPSPGMIQIEPLDLDPGYGYYHGDIPPALTEDYGTHPDFFAPEHIPYGVPFSVELLGGPHAGAVTYPGGETAQAFNITDPPVEAPGATAAGDAPLTIRWSPAQPGATMEIFITKSYGIGGASLLSCKVADDGETTIPLEALQASVNGDIGVQLRRSVTRYAEGTMLDGRPAHVYLIGRHARVGKLTLLDP